MCKRETLIESNNMKKIKYYSKSDENGHCSFSITMSNNGYTPGHPDGEYVERDCAQHFRCDPKTHGFPCPEEIDNFKLLMVLSYSI